MSTFHSPVQMWGMEECGCPKHEDYTSMHGEVHVYHTPECIAQAKKNPNVKALREKLQIAEMIVDVIDQTRPYTRTAGGKVYWDGEWCISPEQSRALNNLILAFRKEAP